MNTLIKFFNNQGLNQVLDWDTFHSMNKNTFLLDNNMVLWVKWDGLIVKYHFSIEDELTDINVEGIAQ